LNTIDELMRRARKIRHEQTRRESEDYLEMVMFRESSNDVLSLFESYFGSPLKASGQDPDDEAERLSNPYGGIAKEQTLYHAAREDADHLAMIWPWTDGKRMTVKIAQECR
jgi:hypothetical protein